MKVLKFDVDESFARRHNEIMRDSRRLLISGLSLGAIMIAAGGLVYWLVEAPWSITVSIGMGLFGIMMALVGILSAKKVGTAQQLYDTYPLAPAMIAEINERDMVIMALVNASASTRDPEQPALALRTVSHIPGIDKPTLGTKIPVAAVSGRRIPGPGNTPDRWQQISPMPIAWGTADDEVVRSARTAIPHDQWAQLDKLRTRLNDVKATRFDLLVLND